MSMIYFGRGSHVPGMPEWKNKRSPSKEAAHKKRVADNLAASQAEGKRFREKMNNATLTVERQAEENRKLAKKKAEEDRQLAKKQAEKEKMLKSDNRNRDRNLVNNMYASGHPFKPFSSIKRVLTARDGG
jgi:hypothetical protein